MYLTEYQVGRTATRDQQDACKFFHLPLREM